MKKLILAALIAMAHYLVGDIEQVCGDLKIVVPERPAKVGSAEMIAVENEDQAHANSKMTSAAALVFRAYPRSAHCPARVAASAPTTPARPNAPIAVCEKL